MKREWVDACVALSEQKADFYSGARKIIRGTQLVFTSMDNSLQLRDCGFTISKQRMLERNYLEETSRKAAVQLWDRRRAQDKYGSVGFSCYNHLVKTGGLRDPWTLASKFTGRKPRPGGTMGGRRGYMTRDEIRKSKSVINSPLTKQKVSRASVMGPCIQALVITYIDKKTYAVDAFYRTTEVLKKFPADLVFIRDVLLAPFDFDGMKLDTFTCHFANVTVHSMYYVTIIPHLSDPIATLNRLKRRDRFFYDWVIKWSGRYVCPQHQRGIAKFAQALRVKKDALERIDGKKLVALRRYINDNHPGYRNTYTAPEGEDE